MMGTNRRQQHPVLIADAAVISIALALFNFVEPGFNPLIAVFCLVAAYAYIAYYALKSGEIVRGIKIRLSAEMGFVVFYYILFFWPYQQELLGIGAHYYDSAFVQNGYPDGANKAMILAVAGLAAFHIGNVFMPSKRPPRTRPMVLQTNYVMFDSLLAVVMVVSFSAFIYFNVQPDDLARYQRATSHGGEEATSVENGLYLLTILLCLIGVSRIIAHLYFGRLLKLQHWIIIAATGFWMLFILIGGDRNNFLVIALAIAGGVAGFLREIRWPILLLSIVPALMIYNTIEIYRQASDQSIQGLIESFEDASNRDDDESSFASTTLTVRATFEIAPQPEPYAMGYYKLVGFGGIIPLVRGALIGNTERFTDTAQVISYYVIGPQATWSLGSNPISDLYMDFGQPGVVFGMAVLGYLAAALRAYITQRGPSAPRVFLYIALVAMMSEVPRYTIDFPVRLIVWGFALFWLYEKLNSASRAAARSMATARSPA